MGKVEHLTKQGRPGAHKAHTHTGIDRIAKYSVPYVVKRYIQLHERER